MPRKKPNLVPGMALRNTVSRNIGEVRRDPDHPNKILLAGSGYVAVRLVTSGSRKVHYPFWRLTNVERL